MEEIYNILKHNELEENNVAKIDDICDHIFNSDDIIDEHIEYDDFLNIDGKRYMFYICSYQKGYIQYNQTSYLLWKSTLNRRLDVVHEIPNHSDVRFLKFDNVPKPLQNWLYGMMSYDIIKDINPFFFGIDVICRNKRDTYMIVFQLFKAMQCLFNYWIIEPREGYGNNIYFHEVQIHKYEAKAYLAMLKKYDYEQLYGISPKTIISPNYVERFLNKEMYENARKFGRNL